MRDFSPPRRRGGGGYTTLYLMGFHFSTPTNDWLFFYLNLHSLKLGLPKTITKPKTAIMYHMHTPRSNKRMHVIYNGGGTLPTLTNFGAFDHNLEVDLD